MSFDYFGAGFGGGPEGKSRNDHTATCHICRAASSQEMSQRYVRIKLYELALFLEFLKWRYCGKQENSLVVGSEVVAQVYRKIRNDDEDMPGIDMPDIDTPVTDMPRLVLDPATIKTIKKSIKNSLKYFNFGRPCRHVLARRQEVVAAAVVGVHSEASQDLGGGLTLSKALDEDLEKGLQRSPARLAADSHAHALEKLNSLSSGDSCGRATSTRTGSTGL